MRRRKFLEKIGFAAGAPLAFQGIPLKVMAASKPLQRMAMQSVNDRVVVIVQLHGGNDGLNTFIPLAEYDQYFTRRANIAIPYKVGNRTAIPLDSTVPLADQVGLHPDMNDFKYLYDTGKAAIFQGVSYENNNGSHFRGRDIWFMGGDADEYFSSGWIGRYLQQQYAPLTYPEEFPTEEMPDPLALEMGNDLSLIFHQEGNIPTSLSLGSSPDALAEAIANLEGFSEGEIDPRGIPPEFLNGSPYGREMDWILGLEDKSETYIERLAEIYENSAETRVDYPERYPFTASNAGRNPLSGQLQLVARLIGGGAKTKVFLVRMGGFDTHANQTVDYDPTMGGHAALLYHISSAMRAFQNDLVSRGIADRVLTLTMSEFGRRIGSNGSYGTDHGTGGPIMMFGAGVNPGIFGTNPDLSQNNVGMQFDYRQIYANVLRDWMEVDQDVIANDIFFRDFVSGPNPQGGNFEPLDFTRDIVLESEHFLQQKYKIDNLHPNPASDYSNVDLLVNDRQEVALEVFDVDGRRVLNKALKLNPGKHTERLSVSSLKPGIYFIKATSEKLNDTKKLIVRR